MDKRTLLANFGRVAVSAACVISTASCGGDLLRTGRGASMLVVDSMEATAGGAGGSGQTGAFLLSDVQVLVDTTINGVETKVPTIFNDTVTASLRAIAKNPAAVTTATNSITLTRYRVAFRRSDGRNTPGVDVPYGFDGGLGVTIAAGGTAQVALELVRHQAKLEPPLKNLVGLGGQGFISSIAEITFFGHDQNGNDVSVTGRIDVQFGDFGDE
jgi:hypothetical protein